MEHFGQVLVVDELNDKAIHNLENILTMHLYKHDLFNQLGIWFEATVGRGFHICETGAEIRSMCQPLPNQYRVCAADPIDLRGVVSQVVTFTSPDLINLPLPSPRYLGLHAACARVTHLSGAGGYIEAVLRDLEERWELANDGSTADALKFALSRVEGGGGSWSSNVERNEEGIWHGRK
jgi:hypothetical protein